MNRYAPNNATLVVVGDVDPEKVYALAKQYYGSLKPTEPFLCLNRKPK